MRINQTVLMSGAEHFSVKQLNPYSNENRQPDQARAIAELDGIRRALEAAGVTVIKVKAPPDCGDGVYTANWGLVFGKDAIMSVLPGPRGAEEAYAEECLRRLGKHIIKVPYRFSGQGDALRVGQYILCGTTYRTDRWMHGFLAGVRGCAVVGLQTVPALNEFGKPVINKHTGWPDSFFYDLDLAVAVLRPDLIAWCPEAFTPESQKVLSRLPGVEKIEVDYEEAVRGFACNLVSTGETVVMSADAPKLKADIEAHGLKTVTPPITELSKGGGYIRCTTLTLD